MTQPRQIEPALVRAARLEKGGKVKHAAEAAGLSKVGYSRWENADKGPVRTFNFFKLQRLAEHLGKPIEALTSAIPEDPEGEFPA